MRFIQKKSGVSPVIATILMVSVTVVLAAVLYVMIIGMGSGSSELAPLGSWNSTRMTGNSSAVFVFGSFSADVRVIDIKMILAEGGNETVLEFPGLLTSNTTVLSETGSNTDSISALYHDNNYQLSNVNGGDKIVLTGLKPNTVYEMKVFHKPTDSVISMTGDGSSIQTQP